jgi:hypothetical protein
MLVVRATENDRAVQSSYYSSCPWPIIPSPNLIKQNSLEKSNFYVFVVFVEFVEFAHFRHALFY